MGLIHVKNLNNTSDRELPSGYFSWIDFWKNKKRLDNHDVQCCNIYCYNYDVVSAHVKISDNDNAAEYVVPLCEACNKLTDNIPIDSFDLEQIN